MIAKLRAALVIARRDYVATVWSRTFILFLIGPLFPIIFGVIFGAIGSRIHQDPVIPVIGVVANGDDAYRLEQARTRLAQHFGDGAVPYLQVVTPDGDPVKQRKLLLDRPNVAVVLSGIPGHAVLTGSPNALKEQGDIVRLMLQRDVALEMIPIKRSAISSSAGVVETKDVGRTNLARGGQLTLLILTMILAGMLLSNLIEEKSSKVIEILAAAVPVDAIFFGKLMAMLGMSLTGITVWAFFAVGGVAVLAPDKLMALAVPAVGWPAFIALGVVYFIASYLLLGSLFLGIGSQASTVREVQTLSMPITMGQLIVFALASTAVEDAGSLPAGIAALFPWSSPFAMLARAAQQPEIWPHFLAVIWQMLWVGLIIRVGARMFRRSVLKSGGSGGLWKRLRGR